MNLTLAQKIGQLMIIGWQSDDEKDLIELIKNYHFGNVILFSRNIKSIEQVKKMIKNIQEAAILYNGYPAIIALDQEGGSVRRITKGLTYVPGPMAIAAASFKCPNAAYNAGLIMGDELNSIGINLNLAPIVDINVNPFNPIIGIRSFSDDPKLVSKLAKDFSKGLEKNNVSATYKHFIGHGDVSVDSHLDLPRIETKLSKLYEKELVPYLNKNYLPPAIMTAHILYSSLDDRLPVSLSEKIINGLLRKEIGYQGLVMTDCFEMNAINKSFSLNEAAVYSIKAKVDIIMVSHNFGRQMIVRNGLIDAVLNKEISIVEIDERVNNVIKFKNKYLKKALKEPNYERNKQIANEIAENSITLVSGTPFKIDENTIVVGVSNYMKTIVEEIDIYKVDVAKSIGEKFNIKYLSIDDKNFNINQILSFVGNKKVILALADSHLTLIQKVLYSQLRQSQKHLMLISMKTPYDVLGQERPNCHIAVYEYTKESVKTLIKVLTDNKFHGQLPVKLKTKFTNIQTYKNKLVNEAISIIKDNYQKQITLKNVADELMISKEHLSRIFKDETNRNFTEYLLTTKINHAKDYLKNTNLKVYEVGYLSGFTDANYFNKIFKKIVGITPKEYRNQV